MLPYVFIYIGVLQDIQDSFGYACLIAIYQAKILLFSAIALSFNRIV